MSTVIGNVVGSSGQVASVGVPGAGIPVLPGQGSINILIVDDEPANLLVLETVLDDPDYRLVRAQSAEDALLALVREEFALLILDIRMPGMSGFELAQLVKDRKKTSRVPIIFLTAYYDKDQHVLEGYGSGAVDYLNKPVNAIVLRSKVSVFADLHRKSIEITLANQALRAEVEQRRRAEQDLQLLNSSLERRVQERTEALRHADDKLQTMMQSITDGLFLLDRSWCFTYCNEQGARLLGAHVDQLIGRCIWELFPQARETQFYDGYVQAVTSQTTVSFEAYFSDPLKRWFQCHCYPSNEGLSVYFHDITDRRDIEQRKADLLSAEQTARTEGERLARAKDEFLTTLSHELRTPLAAIIGWASLLKRTNNDAATLSRGIDAIERNARAQSHLVSDLLDMSRIVSGKMRMNVERLDLNSIALAAADTIRPDAQTKGVTIELKLGGDTPIEILGDPARLGQVCSNLLTNALKFTSRGGNISVSTRVREAHAELAVSDTGHGIAAQFLPHLFDRFSQGDGSDTRIHGGLGLGLSIVKTLVESHSGVITADSAGVGLGASFTVKLPLIDDTLEAVSPAGISKGSANPVATPLLDSQIDLTGLAVLLVEDHPDVLEIERRLLCDYGAVVTTADSAEAAMVHLREAKFDVLLSDLGLPGMDGFDFIAHVRGSLGIGPETLPAAAVSAFLRPEDRERALRAGFQMYVFKPTFGSALARAVLALLPPRLVPSAAMQNESIMSPGDAQRTDRAVVMCVPSDMSGRPPDEGENLLRDVSGRLRVMVVDDNVDAAEVLAAIIETMGHEVTVEHAARKALERALQCPPDVCLLDIGLPEMNGAELARRLRAEPSMANAVLIAVTGYGAGSHKYNGMASLFHHHLTKPADIDKLSLILSSINRS